MAGIDRLTGHAHAWVKDRHRSRDFIEFLKLLDAAYPADTAIEVILDNHSAHVSRETAAWLAAQPIGRFTFTFTPTHGSWLNLVEGALVQMAMPDQLGWRAERAEVVDGQAEGGSGAVRRSPLRPRSHHPVRALVSSLQAQSARPGGDDGRARPVDAAYHDQSLGEAQL